MWKVESFNEHGTKVTTEHRGEHGAASAALEAIERQRKVNPSNCAATCPTTPIHRCSRWGANMNEQQKQAIERRKRECAYATICKQCIHQACGSHKDNKVIEGSGTPEDAPLFASA